MAKYKSLFFLTIIIVSFFQCAKEDVIPKNERVYNFVVKDLFTEENMSNVEVQLLESYGGSFILDSQIESSDQNGKIQFTTSFNQDSVDLLITENMNDPETTVWQPVNVISDYYGFSHLQQAGLTLSHRPILEKEDLITLFSYYGGQLELNFVHTDTTKQHNISVKLTTEESSDFFSNVGLPVLQGSESGTTTIKFPADKNVKLLYDIKEVNMIDWTESLIATDSTFIFGSFEEDITLTITF